MVSQRNLKQLHLVHEYLPSVLQVTPKDYFMNKNSYPLLKFQVLKEKQLIIVTYFLLDYRKKVKEV